MLVLFGILVIIASVVLGMIVLIQNPKGGGLSASLGGFSNQLMGVKQTTDVLEKGTWLFAAIVGILCIVSPYFIKNAGNSGGDNILNNMNSAPVKQAAPAANTTPMPGAAAPDTNKK
ncbi:preprotein translocase subunit SecG [Ferruginibacter profundus]